MPGLYDPTGLSFEQPGGGLSTELNMILGGGREPYRMMPTLAPGIRDFLAALQAHANRGDVRTAEKYAGSRDSEVPTFRDLPAAEEYEQKRHQGLEQGYRPIRDEDLLSWLLAAIPDSVVK